MTRVPGNSERTGSLRGRAAAFQAVHDVLRGQRFVNETLRQLRDDGRLEGREVALAAEIALGAVRHLVTIEHVLHSAARFDEARTKPALRAILLTAAYQIIWMDRIPDFAAVDEAVELARREVGGRTPGMVNAVLRNLTRAIEPRRLPWQRLNPRHVRASWDQACAFSSDVFPPAENADGAAAHLAAVTGERLERYRVLVERFGEQRAEQIAWASQAVPVTVLQRNTLRINAGVFHTRVREAFGDVADSLLDAAFLPSTVNVLGTTLFQEGRAHIQDMTARKAALLTEAQPGERVLDFCAAPGGKSIVLAQQMGDRGEVVACDASPERIVRVRENARRLRLTSIRTHLIQTSDASESDLRRTFDAVLVDAPCSNTGTIARRPEARLGLTAEKLESLVKLQRALLRRAAASVRPGGRLVYSTCSIEPEENEQIVDAFLSENPDWELDRSETNLPNWGPRLSDWRDGGYAARLLRKS
jgi:16S rRNA (cytosine967-C5)-methyltransferase